MFRILFAKCTSSLRLIAIASTAWIITAAHSTATCAATVQERYYGHKAVHDRNGVIAPWYTAQNGQLDFRVRIAAETLKRYPWVNAPQAPSPVPHYVFNGHWQISDAGEITPIPISNWDNGDLGQRSSYILSGLVDYYRYTGDPAAIAHLTYQAEALLDHGLTPQEHPWPKFLISVPVQGKPYGQSDAKGMIQLDIVAEVGLAMLKAYQLTGNTRWFDACKQWGDQLAKQRNLDPSRPPWGRYANPESSPWKDDKLTGGVTFLLYFFDELIRLGYRGPDDQIVKARDAGRAYLQNVLLPEWTVNDVWGRNYWDWADPVQAENVTEFAARYFMDNKDAFPGWRNDARNVLSLFLNHTSVSPASNGEVYSGAWAYPESSGCCGRSLWYGPMELAVAFAQYGVEADCSWGRELARRMQILATYDGHETGVSEDNIDGGFVVNNAWFKIAHPMALKHLLNTIAWMPEYFAPCRENHVLRSTAVVSTIHYGPGRIEYSTFDCPPKTIEHLRLSFAPARVTADGQQLPKCDGLDANGYTLRELGSGDFLLAIRHDGAKSIAIEGNDPQTSAGAEQAEAAADWQALSADAGQHKACAGRVASGGTLKWKFHGNQVRVVGCVGPDGGLADIYLDDVKQLVAVDCWNPAERHDQILYYRNGLPTADHTIRIEPRGAKNERSGGTRIYISGIRFSKAEGTVNFGEGAGPTQTQRMVFGYPGRDDLKDSAGKFWKPGTEVVTRLGDMQDSVQRTWWTQPANGLIGQTGDADLYRYGIHGSDFTVNATVGPGRYYVRVKFAACRGLDTCENCVTVQLNGQEVVRKMDVAATAGGPFRAADIVFDNVEPRNGVIALRFLGGDRASGLAGEAFVQALEIGQGSGGPGVQPVTVAARNLLRNPGFDQDAAISVTPADSHTSGAWSFTAAAGTTTELRRESSCSPPLPGTGRDAVRIVGAGRSRVSQVVAVRPNSSYRGSAWIRTSGSSTGGFGKGSQDAARVVLEELDDKGNVLKSQASQAINQPSPYRYTVCEARTSADTRRIRFVLETAMESNDADGFVSYDQCVLDGPPAPASVAGRVTDEQQRALADAVVTVGDRSIRCDERGEFTLGQLEDFCDVTVRAEKQGCYPQTKRSVLGPGENRMSFVLARLAEKNLLVNGDFEQGFPAARSIEHGPAGQRGAWSFRYSEGTACYIYPESIYDWRKPVIFRGKEAISHVTDGGGTLQLDQEVVVDPGARLTASAWIRGLDVAGNGKGFGADAGDFAGIVIEEIDAGGKVIVTHDRVGIRKANDDFERAVCSFTTSPNTVKIRFRLLSHIACVWQQGAVIYDDCALEAN